MTIDSYTNFIKEYTTPENFEKYVAQKPNYKYSLLDNTGMSAFHAACKAKNVILMNHIIEKGGEDVVSLISDELSPLSSCCLTYLTFFDNNHLSDSKKQYIINIIKRLIEKGAIVNETEAVVAPMWLAANYSISVWEKKDYLLERKIELLKTLVRAGGQYVDIGYSGWCPKKYEAVKHIVDEHIHIEKMQERATAIGFWKLALIEKDAYPLNQLPFELLQQIADYLPQNPWTPRT